MNSNVKRTVTETPRSERTNCRVMLQLLNHGFHTPTVVHSPCLALFLSLTFNALNNFSERFVVYSV